MLGNWCTDGKRGKQGHWVFRNNKEVCKGVSVQRRDDQCLKAWEVSVLGSMSYRQESFRKVYRSPNFEAMPRSKISTDQENALENVSVAAQCTH